MDVNQIYPSKYLAAADLKGKQVPVVINRVVMEQVGKNNESKPIAYFEGHEKGLVLNKTNSMNIATGYGPETNNWPGCGVILFPAWVDYAGKAVEAIRVRPSAGALVPAQQSGAVPALTPSPSTQQPPAPAPVVPVGTSADTPTVPAGSMVLDDDMPF